MKRTLDPIDSYTAQNLVSIQRTRRTDIGPALVVDGHELSPQDVLALRAYFADDADPHSRDRCRCGAYRYVHGMPGRYGSDAFRRASRLRLWFMDHDPVRHFTGWAWMNLTTEKYRWARAGRLHARRPDLCWCEMVDAILLQGKSFGDYECGCLMPMLADVKPFVVGRCYCTPDAMTYESSEPQGIQSQDSGEARS